MNLSVEKLSPPLGAYIQYLELEGLDELYDLKTDPYEMKNLIHQPEAEKSARRDEARDGAIAQRDKQR